MRYVTLMYINDEVLKRFSFTAIDWLGGSNHMVESGTNLDIR